MTARLCARGSEHGGGGGQGLAPFRPASNRVGIVPPALGLEEFVELGRRRGFSGIKSAFGQGEPDNQRARCRHRRLQRGQSQIVKGADGLAEGGECGMWLRTGRNCGNDVEPGAETPGRPIDQGLQRLFR